MPHTWDPSSLAPDQALQRLIDGNRSFRATRSASGGRPWSRRLARRPSGDGPGSEVRVAGEITALLALIESI